MITETEETIDDLISQDGVEVEVIDEITTEIQEQTGDLAVDLAQETQEEKPADSQEESQTEKPAEHAETKSFLIEDEQKEDDEVAGETTVPVHVVAELRRKNRDLRKQLEGVKTRPAAETAEDDDPIAHLDDDEPVTAGEIRRREAIQTQQRQEETAAAEKVQKQNDFKMQVAANEKQYATETSGYDAVMEKAIKSGAINSEDRNFALGTDNPARTIFNIAKRRLKDVDPEFLESLTETKPKTETVPDKDPEQMSQDEILETDGDVIDELFGED